MERKTEKGGKFRNVYPIFMIDSIICHTKF